MTWTVDGDGVGARLDKFLAAGERLGSRGQAQRALERGKIFVNDAEVGLADAARRLALGDAVRVWMDRPGSSRPRTPRAARDGELVVVYEDDALLVINKPAGLLTVPLDDQPNSPSVRLLLEQHLRSRGKRRPLVVHRIDRDTSGLVLFATRPEVQARLKDQFRRREPERVYLAIVYGVPTPSAGTWRDHLVWDERALIQKETDRRDPRAQEAIAKYRLIQELDGCSLIEVQLVSGRRNQIRLQARLRGHTLVGERRYTYGSEELRPISFGRQALHAHRLGFVHPETGEPMTFEAPLPPDMQALIDERILFRGSRV